METNIATDNSRITVAVAMSSVGYVLLVLIARAVTDWNTAPPANLATTVLDARYFFPEPLERTAYFIALFWFPCTAWLSARCLTGSFAQNRVTLATSSLTVATIGWYVMQLERSKFVFDPDRYPVMAGLLVGILVGVLCVRAPKNPVNIAVAVISLLCVLLVTGSSLVGAGTGGTLSNHFQVVASPVVQVLAGKTLLVDATSQYGLFAHFLVPVIALADNRADSLITVLATLTGLSFLLIFLALRQWVRSPVVLLATFCSLIFLHFYLGKLHNVYHYTDFLDPYYQYWPIRFLFPTIALFAMSQTLAARGQWLVTALLAVGVLWNLESGLAALAAWLVYLGYRSRTFIDALCVLAASLLLLTLVGACFIIFVWLRSGTWPDLMAGTAAAQLFFGAGYMMSPLPLIHLWQLVALAYITTLFVVMAAWLRGDRGNAHLAGLTALGALTFSYYVGRSHELLLLSAMYPAILIAGIYVDRRLPGLRLTHAEAPLLGLIMLAGLTTVGTFALTVPRITTMTIDQIGDQIGATTVPGHQLIVDHANRSQPLLILANESPLLHLVTGTTPVTNDDYYGMYFKHQYDSIAASIASGQVEQALVAYRFMQVTPRSHYDARIAVVTALEQSGLSLVATSADGKYQFLQLTSP